MAPNKRQAPTTREKNKKESTKSKQPIAVDPATIKGSDDAGNFYSSHASLTELQSQCKDEWYAANEVWWNEGYGGKTDDEAMIGDEGGELDGEEGLAFLDRLFLAERTAQKQTPQRLNAIDAGAGVGRVTKLILLKRYDTVRLIEANQGWSKRSRIYLGRKRAGRCHFTCSKLEDLGSRDIAQWGLGETGADLVWLQWTLQYMTDTDAVHTLKVLAGGLVAGSGFIIVKENRPFGTARSDRFYIETPTLAGRYDICRPDAHHRLLFQQAGLKVDMAEQGVETNTYAMSRVTNGYDK